MKTNTAIIIPVYNEGPVVKDVINSTLAHFNTVICVNDGSTDNSGVEIEKTKALLISHPINMGQGAALQTGIEFSRNLKGIKYFVTFDADGQHQISDVKNMIKTLDRENVDIILGSRFLGSAVSMPPLKKLLLKGGVKFSNLFSGLKLTDTHNGLRVFNKHVADTMQMSSSDMSHASEILDIIRTNRYKYIEEPVTVKYTEYSMSKGQSMINAVNIVFDTLLKKVTGSKK